MQLLASLWQAAERLIPQPPCPAAGSMAQPEQLLLFHTHTYTNTRTVSTSILYERGIGGRGLHGVDIVLYCTHPQSFFNFSHWSSCQFLPTSFILLTLSAINLLFIRVQPSVLPSIKWLEVVKLWAGLYEGSSRENLSLAL